MSIELTRMGAASGGGAAARVEPMRGAQGNCVLNDNCMGKVLQFIPRRKLGSIAMVSKDMERHVVWQIAPVGRKDLVRFIDRVRECIIDCDSEDLEVLKNRLDTFVSSKEMKGLQWPLGSSDAKTRLRELRQTLIAHWDVALSLKEVAINLLKKGVDQGDQKSQQLQALRPDLSLPIILELRELSYNSPKGFSRLGWNGQYRKLIKFGRIDLALQVAKDAFKHIPTSDYRIDAPIRTVGEASLDVGREDLANRCLDKLQIPWQKELLRFAMVKHRATKGDFSGVPKMFGFWTFPREETDDAARSIFKSALRYNRLDVARKVLWNISYDYESYKYELEEAEQKEFCSI